MANPIMCTNCIRWPSRDAMLSNSWRASKSIGISLFKKNRSLPQTDAVICQTECKIYLSPKSNKASAEGMSLGALAATMWLNIESSVWPFLNHCGQVTHIYVDNVTTIGSDNGSSPGRRQTLIWTNAGILLIVPLGTIFSKISNQSSYIHPRKCIWRCCLENGGHFVPASMC